MTVPSTIAAVCDSVRHAAYLDGYCYCAAQLPLGMEPLLLMVPKDPLRQSSDHALFPIGSDAAVLVDMV